MADRTRDRIEATVRSLEAAEATVAAGALGGAALALATLAPSTLLVVPAIVPLALAATAIVRGLVGQELVVRRRLLREAACRAIDCESAEPGALVRIRGRIRVREPAIDPLSGERVAGWVRWTRRTGGCACWRECDHEGARRLACEGRCGALEIVGARCVARLEPQWIDTPAAIPWRAAGRPGVLALRDGDEVVATGLLAGVAADASYRSSRRRAVLAGWIDGCVLVEPATG